MAIKVTTGQQTFIKKIVIGTPISTAQTGLSIDNFSDFSVATKSDGQILVYDSAEDAFKNYEFLTDNGLIKAFTPGTDKLLIRIDSDKTPVMTGLQTKGNIVPTLDSTFDLGDSAKKFKDLYLSGGTIHLGGIDIKDSGGTLGAKDSSGSPVNIDLQGSISQIRQMFASGGDLTYDTGTGIFQFDVEQVYTKENFDSDFNVTLDSAVLEGVGLNYSNATNTLNIDSAELSSFFRQDIRGYISASDAGGDGSFAYDNSTGVFTYTGPSATEVRAHMAAVDAGGDGSFAYDSSTGAYTYTGPSPTEVRAHFTGDKGLVYNNSTGIFSVDSANLRGIVSATDAGGDGSFAYNSGTGVFTYTGPSPAEVRAHLSATDAGGDGAFAYNSSTGVFTYTGPSATEVRAHLAAVDAGGDGSFSYDSSTGAYTYTGPSAAEVRAHMAVVDNGGDGSLTYDSSTGAYSYTGPSASEVRSHFSAQGDLSYDSSTGVFQFDVEQVYTKENFDSDFNVAMDSGTTNDLAEGSNNLYYTVARSDSDFDKNLDSASTDKLSEGSNNLYYTVARSDSDFDKNLDSASTDKLSEGSNNLYYTVARSDSDFDKNLDSASTDKLSEGSNNLYYTVARADSAAKAALLGGTGVTYDSSTGVIAIGQPVATTDNVTFNQVRGPAEFIIDPATVGDNTGTVKILGNLQVEGTQTVINSTTVSINDKNIVLADSAADAAAADGAGITINGASATLNYSASGDKFVFNKPFEGQYLGFDSDFDSALTTKTTTNLAEGNNLYYTVARSDSDFDKNLDSASTDKLSEGSTNLYYTVARSDSDFDKNLDSASTDKLSEGTSNLYYTKARSDSDFDMNLDSASTDKLSEGSTNLYYTVARADSAAKAALFAVDAGGDGSFTYDSSSGVMTYTGPSASEVRAHFTANKGLSVTSGEFNIDSSNVKGMFTGDKGLAYNSSTGTFDIDSANVRGMFSAGGDLSYNSGTGQFSIDVESVYTSDNFDSDYFFAKDSANTAVERNQHDSDTKSFAVTYATKTADHVYNGQGSSLGYKVDGVFSPVLHFKLGRTYRFTMSASDMSAHPLRLYVDAAKTTQYTTNVTSTSTYTEITVTEATPSILHYQCSLHGYMGHVIEIGTNNLRHASQIIDGNGSTGGVKIEDGNIDIRSGTGSVSQIKFYCEVNNAHAQTLKAQPHSAGSSAVITLPVNTGTLALTSQLFDGAFSSLSGKPTTLAGYGITDAIIDSALTTQLIDSAYVLARAPAQDFLDSSEAIALIDSAYVQARQLPSTDSAATQAMIDSNFTNMSKDIHIPDGGSSIDSAKISFGNDSDLKIFHNGSHSVIQDAGTGSLLLQSNNFAVQNAAGTENQIQALSGGAVTLYHNNNARVATSDSGVSVTGELTADSATIGGLRFPKADGLNNQVIRTDGSGNLSFASVTALSGNLDSAQVIALVDSAYVNLRSDFDSGEVVQLIDSAYVQARTSAGTDSSATQAMIDSSISFQVDSAYVQARQTGATITIQEEGAALSQGATTLNFVGDNVTASGSGATKTITITGTDAGVTGFINNVKADAFTGDASTTAFALSNAPADSADVLVFINGVLQHTNTYSITGSTLTLDSAPDSASEIEARTHLLQSASLILRDHKSYVYTLDATTDSVSGADSAGVTLAYDVGKVDVFANGSRLVTGKDFTATDGTSIVFDSAFTSGNVIEVVSHSKATTADLNGVLSIDSDLTSSSANQIIHTYIAANHRTLKFTAQIEHDSSSSYHAEEVLLTHNGTSVAMTTYAQVLLDSNLGTFDADINSGNVRIKFSPTKTNTSIKLRAIRTPA